MAESPALAGETVAGKARPRALRDAARSWSVRIGGSVLALLVALSLLAPALGAIQTGQNDPYNIHRKPLERGTVTLRTGQTIEHRFWMGTDGVGRDVYSRVLYGGRVSLVVGLFVAGLSTLAGLAIGLAAGYARWLDGLVMRIMDGLMAIPGILLALFLAALWRTPTWWMQLGTVIIAITVVEIPRVARLVRSVTLSIREEPYIEAAVAAGTPAIRILVSHVLPNAVPSIIVQGTYICAVAMLLEANLGFLGLGLSPEVPTWGNIMKDGRESLTLHPHTVFFPGVFLALTVFSVNLLGDGLRDTLDPRFTRRGDRA